MTPNKTVLLLAASGAALALGGCKVDNRPLLARGQPQADAYAGLPQPGLPGDAAYGAPAYGARGYPASYLPPERAYPYAERAYGLQRAFYRAPPDYGFAYADEEPWVWEAADDSLMFAEPYGDDYRFYYYEPGAAYPYFVRDADYGYAYGSNGVLLALFSAAGALLSGDNYDRYYPTARQYWSRGYDLYGAFGRSPRYRVDETVWRQRAPQFERIEQPWINAPDRQPAWRQWRAAAGPAVLQRYAARPGRAIAAEGRQDNGLHLGWDRGQHNGWDKRGGQQAFGGPPQRVEPSRGFAREDRRGQQAFVGGPPQRIEPSRGFAREDRGGRPAPSFAASAERHGRDAGFRGPEPRTAQAGPPAFPPQPGGEGRGRHGGGFAQQAPAQPQQAPQGGEGHGRHGGGGPQFAQAAAPPPEPGGGGHGRQMQAQAQPQPQAHGNGGGGGGQGKGGKGGGQDKPGKDHGH